MSDDKRTSSVKFRVGDVIGVRPGFGLDGEHRVMVMPDKSRLITDRKAWPGVCPDVCTLLRRPVQAGDVLVCRQNGTSFAVTRLSSSGGLYGDSSLAGSDCFLGGCFLDGNMIGERWTHADGTPLEPPQAEAPDAGVPRVTMIDSFGNVSGSARRATCTDSSHASQLADARGDTDHYRGLVDDLTTEIDWLKRELKRLDPRLWKARYGR